MSFIETLRKRHSIITPGNSPCPGLQTKAVGRYIPLGGFVRYKLSSNKSASKAQRSSESLSKTVIVGWIIELAGMALCLYGYFATGNPSFIDWHAITPKWVADFLPNIESEIGMALVFAGMVPIYWPPRR